METSNLHISIRCFNFKCSHSSYQHRPSTASIKPLQNQDIQTETLRSKSQSTSTYSNFFDCKHTMDLAEAHRSFWKESNNLYCEQCGVGISTPAESTEHARSHRKHFDFVRGSDAHLFGREMPGQPSSVFGRDQDSVQANAKSRQRASPQTKIKKYVSYCRVSYRRESYINPYSTQHRNVQAEKDVYNGDLLKRLGGLTVGQRASVDIKAAGSGQVVDYLSDQDLLQLALAVRSLYA